MSWDNIAGQKRVVEILKRTILNNRVPQAYLFTGPDETSKLIVAKELAKALNCENTLGNAFSDGACNSCNSCHKIDKDIYPDVQIIAPEGKSGGIKIEQIHGLRERIYLKPLEGRYKIYIIDKAEGLVKPQEASANALLKLLEEPPNDTIFILIPTESHVLIPTIVSRCQKIKFDYLPLSSFKDENMKTERDELFNILNSPFLKDQMSWAKELGAAREKVLAVLDIMMLYLRDILVYKITNKRDILINDDCFEAIESGQKNTVNNILRKISLIIKTRALIEQNINLQLALEVMFMEMGE